MIQKAPTRGTQSKSQGSLQLAGVTHKQTAAARCFRTHHRFKVTMFLIIHNSSSLNTINTSCFKSKKMEEKNKL